MAIDFTLPELGENIETGDVIQVLVSPGDSVVVDQPVIELETDKATIEVPSPADGTVASVAVQAGDTIAVGQLILTIDGDGAPTSEERSTSAEPAKPAAASEAEPPAPPTVSPEPEAETPPPVSKPAGSEASRRTESGSSRRHVVLAAPSVRRTAREFGVDITRVTGTGSRGRVTVDDVKAYAKQVMQRAQAGGETGPAEPELPDFAQWGAVERVAMRGVRRVTARRMSVAWRTVAHVTQHDRADITQFEAVRKKLKKESPDVPLTVTAFAVQVLTAALKKFPQFNASIDTAREEIVYKQYINIGVAVDTERGLLVPVLKNADQMTLLQISREIAALAEKARTKGVSLDELQGGTFTITNLGGLGGTAFTPIVNYPEVAILGLSRSAAAPVLVDQSFEPRMMLPLSLSYDHRLIDGADAVRFLRWVAERMEQPLLLSLVDL